MKRILLWDIPDEIMLVVAHSSGVTYQNQVGGEACWQAELEGLLCPLDVSPEGTRRIQGLDYPAARAGIPVELADQIDDVLAASTATRFLTVDRNRLADCWEAWIYVWVDSPEGRPEGTGPHFASVLGFGTAVGVLTWPNGD
jgi:hypothetical protein